MKVAVRADASPDIGSGHVMRSLCLADALKARGAAVRFLCRDLPAHLGELVGGHGHELAALPSRSMAPRPTESAWPDDLRTQDLQDVGAALQDWAGCDWLVVDHYAASSGWEEGARRHARRLMAIDDLGRTHDCNLLLDANLYLDGTSPYAGRLPPACRVLLGPAYALLRPEFLSARAAAVVRDGPAQRLLVFMGGMDASNATGLVLAALQCIGQARRPAAMDVVIGQGHPARRDITAACLALGAVLHVQTTEMAGLCAAADLAIGAGGSATWERCAVGLPTLALCLADNQRAILHNGSRAGLLYWPDTPVADAALLAIHLQALLGNSGLRNHLSRNAMAAVDGLGAQKTADILFQA